MIESFRNRWRRNKKPEAGPPTEEERVEALIKRANEKFVLLSQTKQEETATYSRSSTVDLQMFSNETIFRVKEQDFDNYTWFIAMQDLEQIKLFRIAGPPGFKRYLKPAKSFQVVDTTDIVRTEFKVADMLIDLWGGDPQVPSKEDRIIYEQLDIMSGGLKQNDPQRSVGMRHRGTVNLPGQLPQGV